MLNTKFAGLITSIIIVVATPTYVTADTCSQPSITTSGGYRYIKANGVPCSHGQFPNRHNPNTIESQNYAFKAPLDPKQRGGAQQNHNYLFGVTLDGIPFDPGTAEWWNNDRQSGWNYEAMTGFVQLGLDQNHAHVQPNGAYHYHGLPTPLMKQSSKQKMTLVGYAADGFPIYGEYGLTNPNDLNSGTKALKSSYILKSGKRPSGPGGSYDGRFVQDFQYINGQGDLDQCNGRFSKSPEYPNGIYQYYITTSFPFVPRCFMGSPDISFNKHNARNTGNHPHSRPNHPPPRQHPHRFRGANNNQHISSPAKGFDYKGNHRKRVSRSKNKKQIRHYVFRY